MVWQILVILFGVPAIWFAGRECRQWRKLGFALGCISQVFWLGYFVGQGTPLMYISWVAHVWAWLSGANNLFRGKP